jgi:hypothetical protein
MFLISSLAVGFSVLPATDIRNHVKSMQHPDRDAILTIPFAGFHCRVSEAIS